jgi:DNA polymerase III subunit gamma/tau
MAYQVLARKYRPQRFADVAGQDHVTHTLMNALKQNRTAHGYIFSGHRGIGKTTIARILAQALNCRSEIGSPARPTPEPCGECDSCREIRVGNAVDVIEVDAATNRGIDEIRDLREAARYSPARDRYKIYILDEAHQITEAAFNALLKTLEEPPSHVVFMMATTQPEDIPQTIRSRCQHFSFHAVKFDDILAQLKLIAAAEDVAAEDDALALLAEAGDGSMRDALSIMDQAIASAPLENGRAALSAAQIRDLMGSVPNAVFERLLEAVAAGQSAVLMEQLNELLNAGHNPLSLARQLVRYLRNTLMARLDGAETQLLQISADERARAARTALLFSEEEITRNLQIVLRTFDDLNFRQEQRLHLELGLLKFIHAQRLLPVEELLSSLAGGSGARTLAPSSGPRTASSRPASVPAPSHSAASASPFRPGNAPVPKQSSAAALVAERAPSPTPVAEASSPFSAAAAPGASFRSSAGLTEGAPGRAPESAAQAVNPQAPNVQAPNVDVVREAVVAALDAAGHSSAAQLLGAGVWALSGGGLRIEAPIGKKMLGLTVTSEAEKIIRQELGRQGAPARFNVVAGAVVAGSAAASASGSTAPAPHPGSIPGAPTDRSSSVGWKSEALAHPLVERAKEIFKAEVRGVVDLRKK